MTKLLAWLMPVKTLAAMLFAGLICAYMVAGVAYSALTGVPFATTIPFIFVLQALVLAIVIAVLWRWLLADHPHRLRFLPRLVVFCALLAVALTACLLNFFLVHTSWAKLWLGVAGLVVAAVAVLAIIAEGYFRSTGRTYTAALLAFQVAHQDAGRAQGEQTRAAETTS